MASSTNFAYFVDMRFSAPQAAIILILAIDSLAISDDFASDYVKRLEFQLLNRKGVWRDQRVQICHDRQ